MTLPDQDTFSGYGGPWQDDTPVVDPTTEVSATGLNPAFANIAMASRTVERAYVHFVGATYVGPGSDSIAVVEHNAVWGSGTGVKPTILQTSAGTYLITWPASVTAEDLSTHTILIRRPNQPVVIASTMLAARVSAYTANTMTIKTFDAANAANSLNGTTILVSWT